MHTIKLKLKMEDENVMFILQNLQHKGLEIEEIPENKSTKTQMKELFLNKKVDTFKTMDDAMANACFRF